MLDNVLRLHGVKPEDLARMQAVTSRLRARVHTEGGRLEVTLVTADAEAAAYLPQITESLVGTLAGALYQVFGIQGERV